tara:strand:+ start:466 stop:1224 length:759 start_codon:yes stop_codon:yes gene_type:complete
MDLNEIKNRLERLNNPGGGKKGDFKQNFWRPPVGEKSQIRLVPYKHNKNFPFSELYFYFGIGKPRMIALSNFEETDPILEFATQLRKTGEKDNIELSKKLFPKLRIFAPVIVRGEEDKGVRFYEFGKMVYQELLGVMSDEDYGDITDISKGRDITVEVIPAAETGKMFNTTTVRVKPNQTQLVEDAKQVESLLENQKDLVSLFKKYTFDEMKDELQGWLKPAENDGGKETVKVEAPSKTKTTIDSKLDELFD